MLLRPPRLPPGSPWRSPPPPGAIDIRDGKALAAHVALKTAALRRGQPRLREVVVDGHRMAELRVAVRGTPAEEVWIGELAAEARKSIWSGLTGPRDADGETAIGVGWTANACSSSRPRRVSPAVTASRCGCFPRLRLRQRQVPAG